MFFRTSRPKRLMTLLFLAFLAASPAYAQGAGGIKIPYLVQIVGVIVAVFGLVSVIIPDSKMPPIVKQIVNFLALNFGQASNDPAQDEGS